MKISTQFSYLIGVSAIGAILYVSNPFSQGNSLRRLQSTSCRTCRITEETLPKYKQDPRLEYGENPGVIFLLGSPYTGTTAMHYLLGTSENVAIMGGKNIMKPEKEGWHLTGVKRQKKPEARWNGDLSWVNWADLAVQYGTYWDQSKPLLVENSPPEIQAPEKLMEAFTPIYGKVRFILLIRGECGSHTHHLMPYRSGLYKNVVDKYPKETFVIRYEDLCLRWDEVFADLVEWEPLLADIDINSLPVEPDENPEVALNGRRLAQGHRRLHEHTDISVKEYCDSKLEGWAEGLQCERCESEMDYLREWGYDGTLDQERCSN